MSEIIIGKSFNHEAKNIWEACGFDPKAMEVKLKEWTSALNSNMTPSKLIEFIDGLDIVTREKIVLAYYICGVQSSMHFDRVVREMTAVTAQQLNAYRQEIKRLGGSTNPMMFNTKPVAKKNRVKNNRRAS